MDNGFGESNCCPSGVPNSLVYGLQFVVQSGIVTPACTDLEFRLRPPGKLHRYKADVSVGPLGRDIYLIKR